MKRGERLDDRLMSVTSADRCVPGPFEAFGGMCCEVMADDVS